MPDARVGKIRNTKHEIRNKFECSKSKTKFAIEVTENAENSIIFSHGFSELAGIGFATKTERNGDLWGKGWG